MFRFSLSIKTLIAGALVTALAGGLPAAAMARTFKVDCTKSGKLQTTINSAMNGDEIVITGVCQENILIRDKGLTLTGAATPGPHGITGVAPDTYALLIVHSIPRFQQNLVLGTVVQGLTISNPHFACVRITHQSYVEMTDVEASDCGTGGAIGISVRDGSTFMGKRLQLHNNSWGLLAYSHSRAYCDECDLNGNAWAARSWDYSTVSLRDSAVSGRNGLGANHFSYSDIDCALDSTHACSLAATQLAGFAVNASTVAFYDAGDFGGNFQALGRSEAQLAGARQQSNPGMNTIDGGSWLRVESLSGPSRLMGYTEVSDFSHALIHGSDTELDGSLGCVQGGDAWVEPGIDLATPGYTITGCELAPTSCVPTGDVEYIISGGPKPDAGIYVDDFLEVFGDVFTIAQVNQGGGCCQAATPIRFRGNTGEEIRVVARDGNDCYSLRALFLQKADGTCLTQLSGDIFGPNCGSEPWEQTFFDETFVLP